LSKNTNKISNLHSGNFNNENAVNIDKSNLKLLKHEESEKTFLNEIHKIDIEKIKTSYIKLRKKHDFNKTEKSKIFEMRNTFVTSFNDTKEKELLFIEFLSNNNFDLNSLEIQVKNYKSMFKTEQRFPSCNLMKIHKIISEKKEQIISQMFRNNEIKSKDFAVKILNDIKDNNWKISEYIVEDLLAIIQD